MCVHLSHFPMCVYLSHFPLFLFCVLVPHTFPCLRQRLSPLRECFPMCVRLDHREPQTPSAVFLRRPRRTCTQTRESTQACVCAQRNARTARTARTRTKHAQADEVAEGLVRLLYRAVCRHVGDAHRRAQARLPIVAHSNTEAERKRAQRRCAQLDPGAVPCSTGKQTY